MADRLDAFIREYLVDRNATQAAVRAGYSARSAHAAGCRLLKNVRVQQKIAEVEQPVLARIEERFEISLENLIAEIGSLASSNMLDYVSFDDSGTPYLDLTNVERRKWGAIQEMTTETIPQGKNKPAVLRTKVKLYDRKDALIQLAKHFGFQSKHLAETENPLLAFLQALQGTPLPIGQQRTVSVAVQEGPSPFLNPSPPMKDVTPHD